MTPDQIAALSALVGVMERMANWPFASLLLVLVIGPWVMSLAMSYTDRKRIDQVVEMYRNNVHLVEGYRDLATEQADRITLNTQAWIGVRDAIDRNEFCPVIRTKRTTRQSVEYETNSERKEKT